MMKYKTFFILILSLGYSLSAYSNGRSPAVEDFVGVETKHYQKTPKGTEVLFNFGNHLSIASAKQSHDQLTPPFVGIAVLAAFILLPLCMWVGLTKTVSQPIHQEEFSVEHLATQTFESNLVSIRSRKDLEEEVEHKKAS